MRALVVYESVYGNAQAVALGIAEGLQRLGDVGIIPSHQAAQASVDEVDLLVAGGPTHMHGDLAQPPAGR